MDGRPDKRVQRTAGKARQPVGFANRSMKYVVSCILMQNNGATMVSRAIAYFHENDGKVSREIAINDMYICITVFGMHIS